MGNIAYADTSSATSSSSGPHGIQVYDNLPGQVMPLTSVDWAIGAYSTDTGLSSETTDWSNLASSYTLTNVNDALFLLNSGFSASGTLTCSGPTEYTISGVIFQDGDAYVSGVNSYPNTNVILLTTAGDSFYYNVASFNIDAGAGPITETIAYTTYDSVTGWWMEFINSSNTYYLEAISTSGLYFYTTPATNTYGGGTCSSPSISISSLGTTSSVVTVGTSDYNPSIAFEVSEASAGDFLSDNSDFVANAVVTSSEFFYYGTPSTNHFLIGDSSPPSTAYGSGFTQETDNDHVAVYDYYDQFGSETGIQDYIDSEWGVSGATVTQTTGTDLPALNIVCTGNSCPLIKH
jgi:hypothetical protein